VPRRRILINTLSLTHGGGRSYVVNLLRELNRDARGFDFTVLTASQQLSEAEIGRLGVLNVRLPSPQVAARVLFRVLYEEVMLPLRASRFDLLYCLADLAPAVRLAPTVVALRNLNIYDRRFYDTPRLRILERMVRIGLRRTDRVVFPSRAAADLITRRIPIPPARVVVIPHGVSGEPFQAAAGPVPQGHAPYLFLPASLERHKNIPVLLECLPRVRDPRVEVWIAGGSETDPAHETELRALVAKLGIGSRVRFLGRVPYEQVLAYHRGALALVFPSLIETFGHPLLEAMLVGTPVLAADIPSFREIAGDAALYFPPRDPERLAGLVDELGRDEAQTRERLARGRARAREFSWARSVDLLCAVFEETMSAVPAAAASLPSVTDETL
jgi:glycosyltransferase involved in cell wall biosynthesis